MLKPSTRNWWAFFIDYVFFFVGYTFTHSRTVLPSFAATLTTSNVLVGAVSAVWWGAWLLPQLFTPNFLTNKPKKYGYMMWGAAARNIGRIKALRHQGLLKWGGAGGRARSLG